MGRYNGVLSLKVSFLSMQSALFSWHAILLEHKQVSSTFFWNTLLKLLEK